MKVVHFSDTCKPSRNGIVTSVQTLTRALVAVGCECLLVSPSTGWTGSFKGDQLRLPSFPSGLADIRLATGLRRRQLQRIYSWRPDILHVHTPGPVGLLGTVVSKRFGIPLVHTYHTDLYSYADSYRIPTWIMRFILLIYLARLSGWKKISAALHGNRQQIIDEANRLLLSEADIIVLPTAAALQRNSLPINMDAVRFIPTAANMGTQRPGNSKIGYRNAFHIQSDSSAVVLFVGRLSDEKNILLLLDAFRQLLDLDGSVELLLVGPIFNKRKLRHTLRRLDIDDRVILTGPLSPEAVWDAYKASDVFAFPSLTDSQGVVLDEAAVAGLPIVLVDSYLYNAHPLASIMQLTAPEPTSFAQAMFDAISLRRSFRGTDNIVQPQTALYTPERFAAAILEVYDLAIATRNKKSAHHKQLIG